VSASHIIGALKNLCDSLGHISPSEDKALARSRYASHFGPLNQRVELYNETLVLLDTPGLVDQYYAAGQGIEWKDSDGEAINFLLDISRGMVEFFFRALTDMHIRSC